MERLSRLDKGLVAGIVILGVLAIFFIVWKFVFDDDDDSANVPNELRQYDQILYQGVNQSNRIYYSINRKSKQLQTFGTGFGVISEAISNPDAAVQTVTFDYGEGVTVPTEFTLSSDVNKATVIIDVGSKDARSISLTLVSMEDVSVVLQDAGNLN